MRHPTKLVLPALAVAYLGQAVAVLVVMIYLALYSSGGIIHAVWIFDSSHSFCYS